MNAPLAGFATLVIAVGSMMAANATAQTVETAAQKASNTLRNSLARTTDVGVPAAPADGGPRNWEVTGVSRALNLREQPSTNARIIASYAPGTILDNLGCLSAEGRVWCDVQQLGGGPRGYVAHEFLKPAVSPDGSVATGPDDSALRAGEDKFDATGHVPCAQSVGQPMMQCEFGVARAGGGYATVVVKKPDGGTRAIFFRMGKPLGADTSEADGVDDSRHLRCIVAWGTDRQNRERVSRGSKRSNDRRDPTKCQTFLQCVRVAKCIDMQWLHAMRAAAAIVGAKRALRLRAGPPRWRRFQPAPPSLCSSTTRQGSTQRFLARPCSRISRMRV
jgi:hypothetical protein